MFLFVVDQDRVRFRGSLRLLSTQNRINTQRPMTDPVGGIWLITTSDKLLLRNQVKALLRQLESRGAPRNATKLSGVAATILARACESFDRSEIEDYVTTFSFDFAFDGSRHAQERVLQLHDSMSLLSAYIDFKIGDPVAAELLTDTLREARALHKQGHLVCSALLCRLPLEQALKRMCDQRGIEYETTERAARLNEKLYKKGILEKSEWKDVDMRLTTENDIIHGNSTPNDKDILELLEWTGRFIANWLEPK